MSRYSLLTLLVVALLGTCAMAFVPRPGLAKLPSPAVRASSRRGVSSPAMSLDSWTPTAAMASSAWQSSSSIMVADYKSTVEGVVQTIGSSPWLQVFIPTSIGMFVGLTICFILYISAQPSYDVDEFNQQQEEQQQQQAPPRQKAKKD